MDALSTALLDFGALGVMAGALFYMNQQLQKRLDGLLEKFTEQLHKQELEHQKAEEGIRDRYDKIVQRYDERIDKVYEHIVDSLREQSMTLASIRDLLNKK